MKIIVVGGSNSMREEGYVYDLEKLFHGVEILNRSLGASTSSMALFNLIDRNEIEPGDLVIWEYALNDTNHIVRMGYDQRMIMRMVEHTIRICSSRGAAFLPVILTPREIEREVAPIPYRTALHFLFNAYGIPFIDLSLEVRARFQVPHIPLEDYEDENHLLRNGRVFAYLAELIAEKVRLGVKAPEPACPVYLKVDQTVHVLRNLSGGVGKELVNRRYSTAYRAPDGSPVLAEPESIAGRVIGVVVISGADAGILTITSGGNSVNVSIRHDHKGFRKPAVKMLTLPNLMEGDCHVGPGQPLVFTWAESNLPFVADMDFVSDFDSGETNPMEGGIVALLIESGTFSESDARTKRGNRSNRHSGKSLFDRKAFANTTKRERTRLRKFLRKIRGRKGKKRAKV